LIAIGRGAQTERSIPNVGKSAIGSNFAVCLTYLNTFKFSLLGGFKRLVKCVLNYFNIYLAITLI